MPRGAAASTRLRQRKSSRSRSSLGLSGAKKHCQMAGRVATAPGAIATAAVSIHAAAMGEPRECGQCTLHNFAGAEATELDDEADATGVVIRGIDQVSLSPVPQRMVKILRPDKTNVKRWQTTPEWRSVDTLLPASTSPLDNL